MKPTTTDQQRSRTTDEAPAERRLPAWTTDDDVLDTATADTPVETLPLSARARKALHRAGVVTIADLVQLPHSHLSAIRGIGEKVEREIWEAAEVLRERLSVSTAPPLLSGFRGPRLWLDSEDVDLEPHTRERLLVAGITNTADLAGCPDEWIRRLVGVEEAERLRGLLRALGRPRGKPKRMR